MGISIADNFNYQGRKPLDARVMFGTIADMVAFPEAGLYDGIEAFVGATGKYYSYNSSNTVDETLGKWRKRSGGHEIEDAEGTTVTEREVIQFGDGFNATDDSENEKTVVEPNLMTAADMDDVVTPLPSVRSKYHKYSTDEQIVGEWIDGKPIYARTIHETVTNYTDSINRRIFTSTGIPNVDTLVKSELSIDEGGGIQFTNSTIDASSLMNQRTIYALIMSGSLVVCVQYPISMNKTSVTINSTVYYTKTTDTV